MPVKSPKIDWQKFLLATQRQQDIEAAERKLQSLDGRALYEMDFISQMPDLLINRPVNMAMHRTIVNYPVKAVDIMRNCLIDGGVILEVGDKDHVAIQKYVTKVDYDAFTDDLVFLEIKYVFEASTGENLWHIEHWYKFSDGTGLYIQYKPTNNGDDSNKWVMDFEIMVPVFPYVGIPWVEHESFLKKPKSAMVRLELAYRVVGVENIERMGLSLFIEGVQDVNEIKTAPRKMGRRVHILPPDSKFHSPNPDAPGMELMVIEMVKLHEAIEAATGVVTTEKLATLSGISRIIAEKPLIILAEEIRDRFTKGMQQVAELSSTMGGAPELKIRYRSLYHIEDRTVELAILDRAVEKHAITDQEHITGLRELLNLPATEE